MWLRATSIVASRVDATAGDSGAGFALRRLQLHQDGRESLCEVVVNVARQPIAFFENRFAPLLEPSLLGEPALMQRQRGLAGMASSTATAH